MTPHARHICVLLGISQRFRRVIKRRATLAGRGSKAYGKLATGALGAACTGLEQSMDTIGDLAAFDKALGR